MDNTPTHNLVQLLATFDDDSITVPDPHGVVGTYVVRVAWQLDEIELAHLATGGTLWVTVELDESDGQATERRGCLSALRWAWGGLPPHMLEVSAPRPGSVPS